MKTRMMCLICLQLVLATGALALETGTCSTFKFTIETLIPGTPVEVFDAATGDITGWWDHSMVEDPLKMYVDPFPGGAFMEIYDDQGNGVRHAVVTGAERGKMLRYEGPLGMAGYALFMVTTWQFVAEGENQTRVSLEVRAAGEVQDGWPELIEKTWVHFLGRLKQYREAGSR